MISDTNNFLKIECLFSAPSYCQNKHTENSFVYFSLICLAVYLRKNPLPIRKTSSTFSPFSRVTT